MSTPPAPNNNTPQPTASGTPSHSSRLKSNLLKTVGYGAVGGLYFGVPLYLIAKNRTDISQTIKTGYKYTKGVVNHLLFNEPLPVIIYSPSPRTQTLMSKLKTPLGAGLAALFTATTLGAGYMTDSLLRTEKSPNFDRFTRFGAIGLVWNAHKQASADKDHDYWYSFGSRLLFKGGDVGDGTTSTAKAFTSAARDISASFADKDDKEGKIIFAEPVSKKFVTVCVDRSNTADPVTDSKGKITGWKMKPGLAADKDKIAAYYQRMDNTAAEYRKDGSEFRKALEQSASGLVIIEPGYLKAGAEPTFKEGTSCPDQSTKQYPYPAQTYLNGQGHTPDGYIFRK